METLKNKLDQIKNEIFEVNKDVQIVVASKTQSIETLDNIMAVDQSLILGENKVQELLEKYTDRYNWHMIGQLQSNKVKYIIDKVDMIHSLDRLSLADEIEKQAKKRNIIMPALIEINIGCEFSKGGVLPKDFMEFAKSLTKFEHIKIEGVMCIAPNMEDEQKLGDCFKLARDLKEQAKDIQSDNFDIKTMSAGMSNDYLIAVKNGATMIRLGRVLFGERNYN